jgi:hypothetical protein
MSYVILACIGLMCILKYGSILNIPRNFLTKRSAVLLDLFSCSLCLGFWCGVVIGLAALLHPPFAPLVPPLFYYLLPFISAASCWFFDSLLRVIQTIEIVLDLYRDAHISIPTPRDSSD